MIERMRELAGAGYSRKTVADMLRITVAQLDYQAGKAAISFRRMTKAERAEMLGPQMSKEFWTRLRAEADADLKREIALARAERATAPPYKPPPDKSDDPVSRPD